MKQVIAHIDMDCFFAAVEEKYNPSLKAKPLIIGALPEQKRGVVCTANYVARTYGVHSAMSISEAYKLCSEAIFLHPRHRLYSQESFIVMKILRSFGDSFVQASIDEAYVDITTFAKSFTTLEEAARVIKKTILKETRLTCSIGISESKYVAKIASDFQKPVGTTVVRDQKAFLSSLPVGKIPGVGKIMRKTLTKLGIETIGDLAKADTFTLLDNFGSHVIKYQHIAQGIDVTGLSIPTDVSKSVSRERTFLEDIDFSVCYDKLDTIGDMVYEDLGNYGFKTVSIKVRYQDFTTITRDISLQLPIRDKEKIIESARSLLAKVEKKDKVRLFGIKLSNLSQEFTKQRSIADFV